MSDENKKAIRAKLRFTSLEEFAKGYARYVSAGGIFIPTPESKLEPPGTVVRFQLSLAGGENALLGEGRVHKSNGPDPDKPGAPVGLLLKFTRLSQSSKKLVDQIVASKASASAPAPTPAPAVPAADTAPTPQPTAPVSVATDEPPASDFAPTPVPTSKPALDSVSLGDEEPPAADLAPTPMPGSSAELAMAMMSEPSEVFSTREQTRDVPLPDSLAFEDEPPQPTSEMSGLFDGVEPTPPAPDEHWFRTGTGRDQDPLQTSQGEENYALFQQNDAAETGFDIFGEEEGDTSGEAPDAEPEEAPAASSERDIPTAENPVIQSEVFEDESEPEPPSLDLDEGALDMLGSEVELSQPSEAGLAAQSAGRFSSLEATPSADSSPSNPFGSDGFDLPEFSSSPLGDLGELGDVGAAEPEVAPAPAPDDALAGGDDDELEQGAAPASATSMDGSESLRPARTQTASGSYRTLAKTEGGLRINALDDAGASGELELGELDIGDDEDAIDQMFDGLFGGGGGGGDGLFGGGGDSGFGSFGDDPPTDDAATEGGTPDESSEGAATEGGTPDESSEGASPEGGSQDALPVEDDEPIVSTAALPEAPGEDDLDLDIDALRDVLGDDEGVDDQPDVISEVVDDEEDPDFLEQLESSSVSSLEPPDSDVLEESLTQDDEVFDLLGSLDEPSASDGPLELHLAGPSTADSFVEDVEDEDSLAALLESARKDLEEHQAQHEDEEKDPVEELMSGDLPPVPEGDGAFSSVPTPPAKKKGGFLSRFLKRDD